MNNLNYFLLLALVVEAIALVKLCIFDTWVTIKKDREDFEMGIGRFIRDVSTELPEERKHDMKAKDLMQYLEKVDRTQEFLSNTTEATYVPGSLGHLTMEQLQMRMQMEQYRQLGASSQQWGQLAQATSFASATHLLGTSTNWR